MLQLHIWVQPTVVTLLLEHAISNDANNYENNADDKPVVIPLPWVWHIATQKKNRNSNPDIRKGVFR